MAKTKYIVLDKEFEIQKIFNTSKKMGILSFNNWC